MSIPLSLLPTAVHFTNSFWIKIHVHTCRLPVTVTAYTCCVSNKKTVKMYSDLGKSSLSLNSKWKLICSLKWLPQIKLYLLHTNWVWFTLKLDHLVNFRLPIVPLMERPWRVQLKFIQQQHHEFKKPVFPDFGIKCVPQAHLELISMGCYQLFHHLWVS